MYDGMMAESVRITGHGGDEIRRLLAQDRIQTSLVTTAAGE